MADKTKFAAVQTDQRIRGILDAVPDMVAVLDGQREIVYANPAFLDLARSQSAEGVTGARIGEVLSCAHAMESEGGCGESESCRFCGAVQAIAQTLKTGASVTRECLISSGSGSRRVAYDLRAHTTPFDIDGERFVLITLADIGHQKRRMALERIFFHDILNTASSFKLYLDLMRADALDEQIRTHISRIEMICETLIEEIEGQKVLVSAENGTLQPQKSLIVAHEVVEQVVRQIEGQEQARARKIVVAGFSETFSFISDETLVKRVLVNMLKNALEASPEGGMVTVRFGKAASRVRFSVHNPGHMAPEVQKQIFHRSFSTKGEGRGLGTWSMRLLTEDYLGGGITFESTAEEGTVFTLTLPLSPVRAGS